MKPEMDRRSFLKAAPLAAYAVAQVAKGAPVDRSASAAAIKLEPFDYRGVRLHESRWQKQVQAASDFWLQLPEDDILHGYRVAAGLNAPGKALGGWCRVNSDTVFGQWISGMARMYCATGDTRLRDKATRLFDGWSKTVGADGNCRMRHYAFDKLVCGLVDLQLYGGVPEAGTMLEKVTNWAQKSLSRENVPASKDGLPSGRQAEWYTLSENLYRAYQLSGKSMYKDFGDVWQAHSYWNKFANTADPADAYGVHAYSHVNTFSSAAMTYAVTGDPTDLRIIRNAYDWLQNTQCYSTGGFGPSETIVAGHGGLGQVLDVRSDTFETGCGSWAAFKLTRYLLSFTGDARYGDWAERILYNGIGAALPVTPAGKTFYYSDYRVGGGMKVYYWDAWPCCSGTYIQAVADYHNIIYYKDGDTSLYVNLFVPSEVTWNRAEGAVKLAQDTTYPESETTTLKLEMDRSVKFPLKFRVPAWTQGASAKVNGSAVDGPFAPGTWASIERTWKSGDQVELRIPLPFHMQPVDKEHPERVAIVRGPVAMVMEGLWQETEFKLPKTDAEFEAMLAPDPRPGYFRVRKPSGGTQHSRFCPFYTQVQAVPYYMYFDKQSLPVVQW
ncbi:MAG TPA: beta-L-arabinofuranosidase domain-containing protein [Candidatus Acidoferrales bacterium]|nr:beta-L-arabinofuranosidase domain-containing protein [Candidatus Acidoferrales bacterium]